MPSESDKFLYSIAKTAASAQIAVNELRMVVEAVTETISEFPEMAEAFADHYNEITSREESQELKSGAVELRESVRQIGLVLGLED